MDLPKTWVMLFPTMPSKHKAQPLPHRFIDLCDPVLWLLRQASTSCHASDLPWRRLFSWFVGGARRGRRFRKKLDSACRGWWPRWWLETCHVCLFSVNFRKHRSTIFRLNSSYGTDQSYIVTQCGKDLSSLKTDWNTLKSWKIPVWQANRTKIWTCDMCCVICT